MEGLAQWSKDKAPFRSRSREERESSIECMTEILREEIDDEVVQSFVGIAQNLKQNAGVKEGLKSLYKNLVWPIIQNAEKPKAGVDVDLEETSPSAVVLEKGMQKLESRLDHETHPIHNELILKKIFDYSSVNDLKNCRLVSTKWRDLSLTAWRGKAVLKVDKLRDADVEDLVKEGSEFRETPFKCYKMYYLHFDYVRAKKSIWETFSSSIQYLLLYPDDTKTILSAITNLPDLRAITYRIVLDDVVEPRDSAGLQESALQTLPPIDPKLRKISKLEIQITVTGNMDLEPEISPLWEKMFEEVPTLKSLRVQYSNACRCIDPEPAEMMWRTLVTILESVREARKKENFETLCLEELDIVDTQHQLQPFPFTEDLGTIIVESRLPLQRLGIHLGTDPNPSAISNLLQAHAETLQYLKCDSDPSEYFLEINTLKKQKRPFLPSKVVLPNLMEVVVLNGSSVWAFYVLGSLDVPKLETLRIEPKAYSCETEMNIDHSRDFDSSVSMFEMYSQTYLRAPSLPNIKKFFYRGPRNFNATELQSLAKAMPSVTDLTISIADDTFPTVYDLWPTLQSLHILGSDKTYQKLDDYDITGFSFRRGNVDVGFVEEENRVSNITNLKELRKFVFETGLNERFQWPRRPLITDLSAVNGFLKLPKLHFLKLETFCSFSPDVKLALENHLMEINVLEPKDFKDANDAMDADDTSMSESEAESVSDSDGSI